MIRFVEINKIDSTRYDALKPINQIVLVSQYNDPSLECDHLIEVEVGESDAGLLGGYYIDNQLYRRDEDLESAKKDVKLGIQSHYDSDTYKSVFVVKNTNEISIVNSRLFRILVNEQISLMNDSVIDDPSLDINSLFFNYSHNGITIPLLYGELISIRRQLQNICNELFNYKEGLLVNLNNMYDILDVLNLNYIDSMNTFKSEIDRINI